MTKFDPCFVDLASITRQKNQTEQFIFIIDKVAARMNRNL